MLTTVSAYHGCLCVVPGDIGLHDHGTVLLTGLHFYKGKKNIET